MDAEPTWKELRIPVPLSSNTTFSFEHIGGFEQAPCGSPLPAAPKVGHTQQGSLTVDSPGVSKELW